jgi:hypothetical protein
MMAQNMPTKHNTKILKFQEFVNAAGKSVTGFAQTGKTADACLPLL